MRPLVIVYLSQDTLGGGFLKVHSTAGLFGVVIIETDPEPSRISRIYIGSIWREIGQVRLGY